MKSTSIFSRLSKLIIYALIALFFMVAIYSNLKATDAGNSIKELQQSESVK